MLPAVLHGIALGVAFATMKKPIISNAMSDLSLPTPENYDTFLSDLKQRIGTAQVRAAVAVNAELVLLYWRIGRDVLREQEAHGWGAKVIDRLSSDLRAAFPEMKGFSPRNLKYMRAFAQAWPDEAIVQESLAQITWYHNIALLEKLKEPVERQWYARQAVEHGWSRALLTHQIESRLHERQGRALTNFERTLPPPQSDLARQILKDPYAFDFLTLEPDAHERHLERGLIDHIRQFLLELGVGFAFVGRQYPLEVDGQDFFLDLLFYHLKLRCFVVIDLKVQEFRPEDAGKMSFYLSAVDDLLRHPSDEPTIGIILCKTRSRVIVEYTLRDQNRPIGVSEFRLGEALPRELQGGLPTVAQLEAELQSSPRSEPPGAGTGPTDVLQDALEEGGTEGEY